MLGWTLAVERVGGDANGEAGSDGGRGRAGGLASRLVLERRQELGDEVEPRKPLQDLGPEVAGPDVGVPAADVEPGPLAQEVALDVERRIDLTPHVPDDDVLDAGAALRWPTRGGGEYPADVAAGVLERRAGVVERGHQAEIVQHRSDVQQLAVVDGAGQLSQGGGPQVRALAVVDQRGRAVVRDDLTSGARGERVGRAKLGDPHIGAGF